MPMPTKSDLKKCATRNPDGFGFVASNGANCKTTDFDEFMRELAKVGRNDECMIHCRWATHGSVKDSNCHPFYDKETDTWFAHNGVLPIPSRNDKTDSEIAFRSKIVPAIKKYGYNTDDFWRVVDAIRGGSRFAFMHDGKITFAGDFVDYRGCLFSNMYWQWC